MEKDYEGGFYLGRIEFPRDYPLSPPNLKILTPNGRFKENSDICTNMTKFHPESWSPIMTAEKVILGLQSFFYDRADNAIGAVVSSSAERKALAATSMQWCLNNTTFSNAFPQLNQILVSRLRAGEEEFD